MGGEEWISKMDGDVKMCKMWKERWRKSGKWIKEDRSNWKAGDERQEVEGEMNG